jgi:uncharacterized phage protein (TIGR01671 family)|uniref:YopX protein n=1 Tax=virus sp. ctDYl1 TaxID=2826795 RepID=A0A8S5R9S0_9VIRU|nr:MAG TPA: YopX protein [virus sp. ctDYl1]
MREILFKAKRIDNGEWVEGYYYKISETTYCFKEDYERKPVPEHHYILQERMTDWGLPNQMVQIEIDPKTLCQFTGLCDKNGKRIWENNVVWLVYNGEEHIYQIVWDNSELDFKATNGEENYGSNFEYLLCCDEIEVIGNIFDNPELLQENHERENNDKER